MVINNCPLKYSISTLYGGLTRIMTQHTQKNKASYTSQNQPNPHLIDWVILVLSSL